MPLATQPLIFQEPPIPLELLPAAIPWLWIILGTVLLLGVAATALFLFLRKKKTDPAAARRAAFEQSMRDIEQASTLAPRLAAVQISLTIRRYMSAVARDPSLFETHEEFLARHPSLSHWPADTIDSLVSTLKHLAEIKYRPLPDELDTTDLVKQSRTLLTTLDGQSAA